MSRYYIDLTEAQEQFLDIYLDVQSLKEGHTREMYPGLIAHNFINSMMKRLPEFLGKWQLKHGKPFELKEHK